jgi:Na+:H+ antiporter, NhaA family
MHSAAARLRGPRSFQRFFQTEAAGGLLLLLCAGIALGAANSRWADAYGRQLDVPITIGLTGQSFSLTLHQWINEGLMTIFFLLVGLEIKREFLAGELATRRQAALPIAGAVGGMIVPALVYLVLNRHGIAARGWAIPMATDIAFALGTLVLIAPGVPVGAKVFLTALAIVDDMGAVLVIALFYTGTVAWTALSLSALTLVALVALNVMRVRRLMPYLLLGVVLWFFIHESGVHSTIAGVLLAVTIPTRTRINAAEFSEAARMLVAEFDRTETGDYVVLSSKGQQEAIYALGSVSEAVIAPLLRLEHALHGFSAFVVMPLFALSNAGVSFAGSLPDFRVAFGIVMGLAIGKPFGITAAAAAAVALKAAALPRQVTWGTLHGCAWLGGIGFTMALFIANLAFENTPLLDAAKLGILAGSIVVGVVAGLVLSFGSATLPEPKDSGNSA